ncbi:MAG: ABC transporter permease [Faecousia sp.]
MKKEQGQRKISKYFRTMAIYLVLVVLIIIFASLEPTFIGGNNIITILRQVSILGITAVGMMLPILLAGIDLSVGAIISMVNVGCAYMMVNMGMSPVLAAVLCVLLSSVVGAINGILIAKVNIPPLIMTYAMQMVLTGSAYLLCKGLPIYGFPQGFTVVGQGYVWKIPIPVIIMAVCLLIGAFMLSKTYFGRYFYAVGGNEEASRLSGINVTFVKVLAYTLSGFFAGIAGIVMLSRVNSGTPSAGSGFEMDVLTAIVLGGVSVNGGRGKIYNVVAGVLIIGALKNGLILLNVDTYVQYIIQGVILALAVGYDCLQNRRRSI